jgi:hypothetical protein
MTEDYPTPAGPPVPPQELVGEWSGEAFGVASIAPSGADRHVAAKAAAWGYQQARKDARRVEARELSAFGLLAGLNENTTADGGDSDG